MEVAVADGSPVRLGRAVRQEPAHRLDEALNGTAGDASVEVGQHAVKTRHLSDAFLAHGAEQRSRVEIVEPELRPREYAGNAEPPNLEHRQARRQLHYQAGTVPDRHAVAC